MAKRGFIGADGGYGVTFDGTNDYLTRDAGLTGAADSGKCLLSFWFTGSATDNGDIIDGETGGNIIFTVFCSGGFVVFEFFDSVGNVIAATSFDASANALYHVLVAVDIDAGKCQLAVNDAVDLHSFVDAGTMDFTGDDWYVGAYTDGSSKLKGDLADFWFAPGVFLDLTVEANRRKFINADLSPVFLGANGELPTGTSPLIYLSGTASTFYTNKGTGGGFTLHGALDTASSVTGIAKCFNSRKTCQSTATFNTVPAKGFTTAEDASGLPANFTSRWNAISGAYAVRAGNGVFTTLGSNLRSHGTNIGDATNGGGLAAAFDNTTSQAIAASAEKTTASNSIYAGKNFSSAGGRRINKAVVYGTNNQGYVSGANPTVTLTLYGKATAPANATDGTSLGTTSFTDTANESASPRTITCSDQTTRWNYVWVTASYTGTAAAMGLAEVQIFESLGGIAGTVDGAELSVELADTDTLIYGVSWDTIGQADADVDFLLSVYIRAAGDTDTQAFAVVRGGGGASAWTGYILSLVASNGLHLFKSVAGSITTLGTDAVTVAVDTRYYLRLRAAGTAIKGKFWAVSTSEPAAWNIEVTDSDVPDAGWVGFGGYQHLANPSFDYFACDTQGNAAPLPSERTAFNAQKTLRFAKPTSYLHEAGIEAFPSIDSVSVTPAEISLGENLGTRATVAVTFKDHPDSDTTTGLDKYVAERPYDPFKQGTFFGKLRARQPFLQAKNLRLIQGFVGDALTDMTTRHYVVDSFDGPTPDGKYTLNGKDWLKLASGDRAQAPIASPGSLSADLTSGGTSATLIPSGIGDTDYASSGWVNIGGNEICAFTRSGDVLTLTRGQLGSTASAHSQNDRVQTVLAFVAMDPGDIIAILLETYAGVPASYIDGTAWTLETHTYVNKVFTGYIAEPTSVADLVSEIIKQTGMSLWWDDVNQKIDLQVLRAIPTSAAVITEADMARSTFQTKEQPEKRISQVWLSFGQVDPTKPLDNDDNYRSVVIVEDAAAEDEYGTSAIDKIKSRWIAQGGAAVAEAVAALRLSRYRDPPRRFDFKLLRGNRADIVLGGGYQLQAWNLQKADGSPATVPIQITRINPGDDYLEIEAEEMLFSTAAPVIGDHTVTIDSSDFNLNLRTIHDTLYTAATSGDTVTLIIKTGVIVGSTSTGTPAFDLGTWDSGVTLNVVNNGRIQGAGGKGGGGAAKNPPPNGSSGGKGGTALYSRFAFNLDNTDGEIWAGGGGGGGGGGNSTVGGSGGGGGAGTGGGGGGSAGSGGGTTSGGHGSATAGGHGGSSGHAGGDGGDPGADGSAGASPTGSRGSGGSKGNAIDGVSFATISATGSILGNQVN